MPANDVNMTVEGLLNWLRAKKVPSLNGPPSLALATTNYQLATTGQLSQNTTRTFSIYNYLTQCHICYYAHTKLILAPLNAFLSCQLPAEIPHWCPPHSSCPTVATPESPGSGEIRVRIGGDFGGVLGAIQGRFFRPVHSPNRPEPHSRKAFAPTPTRSTRFSTYSFARESSPSLLSELSPIAPPLAGNETATQIVVHYSLAAFLPESPNRELSDPAASTRTIGCRNAQTLCGAFLRPFASHVAGRFHCPFARLLGVVSVPFPACIQWGWFAYSRDAICAPDCVADSGHCLWRGSADGGSVGRYQSSGGRGAGGGGGLSGGIRRPCCWRMEGRCSVCGRPVTGARAGR